MENIKSTLDKLASETDHRVSVFDIEILRLRNKSLTLCGRLLDDSQLEILTRHFSSWKLDTSSIRILRKGDLPRMYVTTNLTGLYEKPVFGLRASELCYGTEVEVLEERGEWVFARLKDGYLGWAYKPYLTEGPSPEATHLVVVSSYGLRTQPDTESEILARVVSGTCVSVKEIQGAWARVSANRTGWMPLTFLRDIRALPGSLESKRKALVTDSARMMGVPYLWGGTSGNGIDCSGFARLLHSWIGVDIPRDADMQYAAAKPVEPPFETGDLLFFGERESPGRITHVGLSLGGWKIIHSSRTRNGVYIDNVQEQGSLKENFISAGSFLR
jgi:hypothetical protein